MIKLIPRGFAAIGVVMVIVSLFLPWGSFSEGRLEYRATGLTMDGKSCDWFVGFSNKALCRGGDLIPSRIGVVLGAPLLVIGASLGAWGALRPSRARSLTAGIAALAAAFLLRACVSNAMIATAQRSITTDLAGLYVAVTAGALLGLAGAFSSTE